MIPPPDTGRFRDGVVAVFLFAALVLLPPVAGLWATASAPWYLPYLVWLGIIALIALVSLGGRRHGR